jgi:serine O-acetyltransferase
VLLKPVPPGATAVGIPARIIDASDTPPDTQAKRFTAYGVTLGDDPVAQAMKGLIDHTAGHEHQIALLWAAIEKLSGTAKPEECVPAMRRRAKTSTRIT